MFSTDSSPASALGSNASGLAGKDKANLCDSSRSLFTNRLIGAESSLHSLWKACGGAVKSADVSRETFCPFDLYLAKA
jgi:hypothetical protein